jgi:hypothetical protein
MGVGLSLYTCLLIYYDISWGWDYHNKLIGNLTYNVRMISKTNI